MSSPAVVRMMSDLTTWRIGGPAKVLDAPSAGVLAQALACARRSGMEVFPVGRGSNLLVSDLGWDGLVIRLCGDFARVAWLRTGDGWKVRAGAAAALPGLAGAACMKGAAGLEFAAGIPGTLGGAVFMNAGAYGSSISGTILSVTAFGPDGEVLLTPGECGFGYRSSMFQGSGLVVTGVELGLPSGPPSELKSAARGHLSRRRSTIPLDMPNAGSVFRRPAEGPPPGRLIEEAGMKGASCGGAMVSPLHANFIVNTGGATAADVTGLMHRTADAVERASGIRLEPEVRFLGLPAWEG